MLALLIVLATALASAGSPACGFGDARATTFSFALAAPRLTLWATTPATYEIQAPDADLRAGALAPRTPLAIESAGTVGLFVRLAEPSSIYLCPSGARPTFVFLPMLHHVSSRTAAPSSP